MTAQTWCVHYPDNELLKAIVEAWVEGRLHFNGLVLQKSVTNALNSALTMLKTD